jgi:hypothetical protein
MGGISISNIYCIAAVYLVNKGTFLHYEILINICISAMSIVSKSPAETTVYIKVSKRSKQFEMNSSSRTSFPSSEPSV